MAKRIEFKLDGKKKTLSEVARIRTYNSSGKTNLWIPEDETKLGLLGVTRDGTYLASDEGFYGYSKVLVDGIGNVDMGTLGTKVITKNGTYIAQTEGLYGYSSVTVNVSPKATDVIKGKDKSGNDVTVYVDDAGYIRTQ